MIDTNPLKVLLYSDGTKHSFSAAVYAANLFYRIPNMHLTVLKVKESIEASIEGDFNLMETWSSDHTADWKKHLIDETDFDKKNLYFEIFNKTNEIFSTKGHEVKQKVIYANSNISDTVEAILAYAAKKEFELIIMGTRGLTSLKGLIYGSLAHSVLNKSEIPVLLIKKLPQEFIDRFCLSVED